MKFILIMTGTKAGWDTFGKWPKEAIRNHIAFMRSLNQQLRDSGEFVLAEGLAMPDEAKIVRAAKDGSPVVESALRDGKEFLIGFWMVQVANAQRAYEIAAQASAAPGPGGAPIQMPIEVRQVMSGPPEEFA
jgi:hypothetical protein